MLWFSCDKECLGDGLPEGRSAYMSTGDHDKPPADAVDLVFRVDRRTVCKSMNGTLVCPHENGTPHNGLTCSKCQLCFKDVLLK
jgi:hypothetical protein